MRRPALVPLGVLLVTATGFLLPAHAQTLASGSVDGSPAPVFPETVTRDDKGRVTMRATRLAAPLQFDGALDEAFYTSTPAVSDFIQQEPFEGEPATEKTEVWVFYDAAYVYVAARCWESATPQRVMSDMRRDSFNLYNNDHVAVMLDTFYDRRNGYSFSANAQGGMTDVLVTNEQGNWNWNGIWDVRTAGFDEGWTIEFRIPFRSLRFREGGRIWGFNVRRMVRWKNEISFLSPIPASYNRRGLNMTSFAGTLVGVESPSGLRNLDVKPYALGSIVTDRLATPPATNDARGEVGVDVRWGITQEFVADLTYNTDFAQVEDDEQQVNLTRFTLFFPEKREFFLEGQEIFAFGTGGGGGGAGGGGGGGGGGGSGGFFGINNTPVLFFSRRIGLSDEGLVVPILGGGRLLGRAGPYQVGALTMRTNDAATVGIPTTDFSVLRLNRDVLRRSRVGVMATRRAPASGHDNYAFGLDATFNVRDTVSLQGYWARTDTFQRRGDDTSYRGRYDWNADRYGLQVEHLYVGEDFNPEIGFLRREAFRQSTVLGRFSPRPQNLRGVRKLFYEASVDYVTSPFGDVESKKLQGTFRMELTSGDQFNFEYIESVEAIDEPFEVAREVLVPMGAYTFQQVKGSYNFGPQRRLSGFVTIGHGSFYDGTLTELSWRGRAELTSQFYLEPTLSWNRVDGPWGRGNNNLFSTRVTYTLSPQMFVGALVQYQSQIAALATNARFRWEYRPGSELFIVYSDGRTTLGRGFPSIDTRSMVVKVTRLFRW